MSDSIRDDLKYDTKCAVVTGHAGRLGSAVALALIENGYRVVGVDLKDPKIDGVVSFVGDVTDEEFLTIVLSEIDNRQWKVRALVNTAAIDAPPGSRASGTEAFEHLDLAAFQRVLNVNITGTVAPCKIFGSAMAESGGGAIVNFGSIYGVVSPNQDVYQYRRANGQEWFKPFVYSVSKSAVMNLTRYLATYWAEKEVRVNTIVPAGVFDGQDEAFLSAYLKMVPMQRMAEVQEVVDPVVFLCSEKASYITGSALMVDGGYTSW